MNVLKMKESLIRLGLIAFLILPNIGLAQDLVSVLKSNRQTTSFAQAIEASGLDEKLSQDGPFTIFAPTNGAFSKGTTLISSGSGQMKSIILNHIMTGMATARSLRMMNRATTLGGLNLTIEASGDKITVNKSPLLETNIRASNGVIHIIDGTLK